MFVVKNNEDTRKIATRFTRQQIHRPRHQTRNVQWVDTTPTGGEQVFLQTSTGRYLTVRNGAIVGDWFDENNKDDFVFNLETMKAAYSKKIRKPKVVFCCKIRWKSYWIKTFVGSDGALGMKLSEDDTDDYTTVFKRRAKSNLRYGTGFECLLFKNNVTCVMCGTPNACLSLTPDVYLQYNPRLNEVDIKPYNPRRDIGANLKFVPVSTLFHVRKATEMSRVTNTNLHSSNDTSPRFSANIDEFETDEETVGCCFKCFCFFRKNVSHSDTGDSMDSEPTLPSADIASRTDTDGATT